jgi:hypothetical protein
MQDFLKDIVQHTHSLGIFDMIKVTGTDQETAINSVAEDRSVILEAKFKAPIAEFVGTFGMPNLSKLNTILNIPEYKEDAQLSITTQKDIDGEDVLSGIHFENKTKDFKNDYRFMAKSVITAKLQTVKFKGVKWHVDVVPTNANIQRMKFQASANNEETTFVARTENGALKFYFGDPNSHAGNFTFEQNVTGTLSKSWAWPVAAVISILSLPGDKTFKISDEGAAMITVDSGLAEYSYIIPAQTK